MFYNLGLYDIIELVVYFSRTLLTILLPRYLSIVKGDKGRSLGLVIGRHRQWYDSYSAVDLSVTHFSG